MALLGMSTLFAAGCHSSARTASRASAREKVYAAVLRDVRRDTAATWVVVDTLLPTHDVDAEQHEKVMTALPITRGMLDAFLAAQRRPADRFGAGMLPGVGWTRVSSSRLDSLRAIARTDAAAAPRPDRGDGFWRQWYLAYPGSGGYVILSPASISTSDGVAVVQVRIACGPVCGETELRVLRRDNEGVWRTTGRVRLSES
jgi:hypothetical protein